MPHFVFGHRCGVYSHIALSQCEFLEVIGMAMNDEGLAMGSLLSFWHVWGPWPWQHFLYCCQWRPWYTPLSSAYEVDGPIAQLNRWTYCTTEAVFLDFLEPPWRPMHRKDSHLHGKDFDLPIFCPLRTSWTPSDSLLRQWRCSGDQSIDFSALLFLLRYPKWHIIM